MWHWTYWDGSTDNVFDLWDKVWATSVESENVDDSFGGLVIV
jgi:hypothetical protein